MCVPFLHIVRKLLTYNHVTIIQVRHLMYILAGSTLHTHKFAYVETEWNSIGRGKLSSATLDNT